MPPASVTRLPARIAGRARFDQERSGLGQRFGRGSHAAVGDARGAQVEALSRSELHVYRQREENRAGGRGERHLGRAADRGRHIFDATNLRGPLGPRPRNGHHVALHSRFLEAQAAVLLAGHDEQRCTFAVGVENHAHGVAQPAGDVDARHAQAA